MRTWNKAALLGIKKKTKHFMIQSTALLAGAIALAAVSLIPADTVRAEEVAGNSNWSVSFTTDKEMVSNFKTSDLDDTIYGMQPGDTATITLKLSNENDATTDWYMTNKVLKSLEGSTADKATAGGAYTYKLTYTNPGGEQSVLFDSEAVGGDDISPAGEGLKEATDALQDYFYLDELSTGQSGQIELVVGLDGETQGNDYQDTLADLQMNFAVELPEDSTATTSTQATTTSTSTSTSTQTTTVQTGGSTTRTTVVKTGDDNNILPYILVLGACGLFILFFAIFCVLGRRKEKEGGPAS